MYACMSPPTSMCAGTTIVTSLDGTVRVAVEVISAVDDHVTLLKSIFDFEAIRRLMRRPDFSFSYDCMHGVQGGLVHKDTVIGYIYIHVYISACMYISRCASMCASMCLPVRVYDIHMCTYTRDERAYVIICYHLLCYAFV